MMHTTQSNYSYCPASSGHLKNDEGWTTHTLCKYKTWVTLAAFNLPLAGKEWLLHLSAPLGLGSFWETFAACLCSQKWCPTLSFRLLLNCCPTKVAQYPPCFPYFLCRFISDKKTANKLVLILYIPGFIHLLYIFVVHLRWARDCTGVGTQE